MAENAAEHYKIFTIESNRPLFFGESYLIATAYNSYGPYWFGEQFLLLERPNMRLDYAKYRLQPPTYGPHDVSMVNAEFVFEGVQDLAKSALASILIHQYEVTKTFEVFGTKFDFKLVKLDVLVRCWARKLFHSELITVANTTETNKLQPVLRELQLLPVFEPK